MQIFFPGARWPYTSTPATVPESLSFQCVHVYACTTTVVQRIHPCAPLHPAAHPCTYFVLQQVLQKCVAQVSGDQREHRGQAHPVHRALGCYEADHCVLSLKSLVPACWGVPDGGESGICWLSGLALGGLGRDLRVVLGIA